MGNYAASWPTHTTKRAALSAARRQWPGFNRPASG